MNDKSPSSCVSRNDVANLGCDVAPVISTILCFAYLPRYLQPVSQNESDGQPEGSWSECRGRTQFEVPPEQQDA